MGGKQTSPSVLPLFTTPVCSYWLTVSQFINRVGSFRSSLLIQSHLVYCPLVWLGNSASLVPCLGVALQPALFRLCATVVSRRLGKREDSIRPWGRHLSEPHGKYCVSTFGRGLVVVESGLSSHGFSSSSLKALASEQSDSHRVACRPLLVSRPIKGRLVAARLMKQCEAEAARRARAVLLIVESSRPITIWVV